jgi:hypothetical protein
MGGLVSDNDRDYFPQSLKTYLWEMPSIYAGATNMYAFSVKEIDMTSGTESSA